jgi:hypothetical protein
MGIDGGQRGAVKPRQENLVSHLVLGFSCVDPKELGGVKTSVHLPAKERSVSEVVVQVCRAHGWGDLHKQTQRERPFRGRQK